MSNKLKKAFCIAALVLFGLLNVSNFGADDPNLHVDTYKVKSGDTFWYVTQIYRDKDARNLYLFDYQDEVRRLNPYLADNHCQLQPGDIIKLQYAPK